MNLKKIHILTLMVILSVLVCGMGTVAASHTTQIKVYQDYVGRVSSLVLVEKGHDLVLQASLHVDGNDWNEWFRYLHFKVYDSNDNLIFDREYNTELGMARVEVPVDRWGRGFYKLIVSYDGNTRDDYLPTEKVLALQIK